MDLEDFDFQLPDDLIAQSPPADRSGARMLVVHRHEGRWEDRTFRELPHFLHSGDCLVLNDSRVFPARLFGHRAGRQGRVEVFLLRPMAGDGREWEALVRPGRKMPVGERIEFDGALEATVVGRGEFGERTIRFAGHGDLYEAFEEIGHVPLPPYIRRGDEASDRERYQTVYAREKGSVAAPTAGLHFTPEVLADCRAAGAEVAYVTLHVGLGTFQPLHAEQVEQGKLHTERYRITEENAAKMAAARRLVAVGTTSMRTIESTLREGEMRAQSGETDIFIYPGYAFRGAGAMLTNFHLPQTSLLLLVCAFAGKDLALAAYRHAVEQRYRFYSYGDCMLIV
ncbi:MAG TPA: tRNA preQ1(34) S-adenosylmethionine ribosyltransferase-isomerase QueA [Candidatus Sulfopaludibacter sp.]|nr:tRNA preQ1(34) S-adenosylmethionine ribosyltransferase-isomerase QueA [Candidatus Sulfopaludibacter sp.]